MLQQEAPHDSLQGNNFEPGRLVILGGLNCNILGGQRSVVSVNIWVHFYFK